MRLKFSIAIRYRNPFEIELLCVKWNREFHALFNVFVELICIFFLFCSRLVTFFTLRARANTQIYQSSLPSRLCSCFFSSSSYSLLNKVNTPNNFTSKFSHCVLPMIWILLFFFCIPNRLINRLKISNFKFLLFVPFTVFFLSLLKKNRRIQKHLCKCGLSPTTKNGVLMFVTYSPTHTLYHESVGMKTKLQFHTDQNEAK